MKAVTNFGYVIGKDMVVIRDIYVLKLSGEACRAMLDDTLIDIGYRSSRVDMDFWMNPNTNPQTGNITITMYLYMWGCFLQPPVRKPSYQLVSKSHF